MSVTNFWGINLWVFYGLGGGEGVKMSRRNAGVWFNAEVSMRGDEISRGISNACRVGDVKLCPDESFRVVIFLRNAHCESFALLNFYFVSALLKAGLLNEQAGFAKSWLLATSASIAVL